MTAHPGAPSFGKGVAGPNMEEADSFLDEVDDVSRLIEGLHSGKISADYVDKRIKEKDEEEQKAVVAEKKKEEDAEKKKYENLPEEKKKEIKVKVRDRQTCSNAGRGVGDERGSRRLTTTLNATRVDDTSDLRRIARRALPQTPTRATRPPSAIT